MGSPVLCSIVVGIDVNHEETLRYTKGPEWESEGKTSYRSLLTRRQRRLI